MRYLMLHNFFDFLPDLLPGTAFGFDGFSEDAYLVGQHEAVSRTPSGVGHSFVESQQGIPAFYLVPGELDWGGPVCNHDVNVLQPLSKSRWQVVDDFHDQVLKPCPLFDGALNQLAAPGSESPFVSILGGFL